MPKPKRVFKSEIDLAPALKVELAPPKTQTSKDKDLPDKEGAPQGFEAELILGIIERIKKL